MSSEELKVLIKKRSTLKGRHTLFKNYLQSLNELIGNTDIHKIDKAIIIELEIRIERRELMQEEFNNVQDSIEQLSENIEEQIKERDAFERSYFETISACKKIISDYSERTGIDCKLSPSVRSNSPGSAHSETNSTPRLQNIKLPQIQLPKFNGLYDNWLEFRDTFESLIHSNISINEIQKFHYLRAALEDGAAQVIRSLEFSAANYSVAWDTLCNRYNNRRLLVHNHVKSLFNLPVLAQESAFELRKMLDTVSKHLRSLATLKQPTEYWDTLLIYIFCNKLDKTTAREWEELKVNSLGTIAEDLPTLEDFKMFLKHKADLLETLELSKDTKVKAKGHSNTFTAVNCSCALCKGSHYIQNCSKFLKLPINERIEQVKKLRLCINCLRKNHVAKVCHSGKCRKCMSKHNTLLHFDKQSVDSEPTKNTTQENANNEPENSNIPSVSFSSNSFNEQSSVLLATALIQVLDNSGFPHTCRALLDSASQSNFITAELCDRLRLEKSKVNLSIIGINQITSNLKHKCRVQIQSCHNSFETSICCMVLHKISEKIPSYNLNVSSLNIPNNLRLADPDFYKSDKVDMLLGAELFFNLLCVGQVRLGTNMPTLQKTLLGWILAGPINSGSIPQIHCNLSTNLDIQGQLAKFWEIEENLSKDPILSRDEQRCEEIFVKTVRRDRDGRFVVQIPLKEKPSCLGDSRQQALSRFRSMETKLSKNAVLKQRYLEFMNEYEALGHMSKVQDPDEASVSYYFPHHGVLNEKSQTTKLRVVFDGSAPSDTGVSLNDLQLIGPTIQDDLMSIILRFRQHQVVICADIVKMYRQILIDPSQRSLQRIFWRANPSEDIEVYELNTVSYGTSSAPFLAVRCLKQLALENAEAFPRTADVISNDFYMDDMLSGAETVAEAVRLCNEVSSILNSACFKLQKWASNSKEVLQNIQVSNSSSPLLKIGEKDKAKTLGLYWSCELDSLKYSIEEFSHSNSITKRSLLSDIAQIFDPLGLLGPCIIIAKTILQRLWLHKLSWDEALPANLDTQWRQFREQLSTLNDLQIPRCVLCRNIVKREIHGFADSSLEAYGAAVYVRSVSDNGHIQVSLLCSKTRVAPLKVLTIPRLELCGALILAQLVNKVKISMKLKFDAYFYWSDSTVCLSWIKTPPNLLQTFVGHRVSQIQSVSNPNDWNYIRSKDNPADVLSRGIKPSQLQGSTIWWHGPSWLLKEQGTWPKNSFQFPGDLPELKKQVKAFIVIKPGDLFPMEKISSLVKLKRILAYCLRFLSNCKTNPSDRQFGPLTANELDTFLWCLIKIAQQESFPCEIRDLSNKKAIKGSILGLSPFLDSSGILRVGGRLQLSQFDYDKKHPALLSGKHHLTKLIFAQEHLRLCHAGPQLLLFSVRDKYWPLGGRNLARKIVHSCVRCYRCNPTQISPIMGMLPERRISPAPAFHIIGVDYAGPFLIKDKKGRGNKTSKCYISLFVCFTTKSVHLELVSDLTTEVFIAAFRRFVSRRGKPLHVYSDNGTNFVGADAELRELAIFLQENEGGLAESIANQGVNWHFIPAFTPHFGGLWEAGVKACKKHLKRVLANASLTFEEFYTVLTEIEAILNSRPLTPISSDPNDMSALTPSHFLIGKPLTSLPDPDLKEIPEFRLSRYQRLQQLQQHFWQRWSKEYVSELQNRTKWRANQQGLKIGSLVIIKEDNVPPLRWQLGRIISLYPGPDGIARVASVKTIRGVVKRSFSKICPLPIETDLSDSDSSARSVELV